MSKSTSPPIRRSFNADSQTVQIPYDVTNEQILIAACLVSEECCGAVTKVITVSDIFHTPQHRIIYSAILELRRRNLSFDFGTVQTLSHGQADAEYITLLINSRPDPPPNLDYHIECLLWDSARAKAVTGPIASLLDALRNPAESPDKIKSLARQTLDCFHGYRDRTYAHDPNELIRSQISEIRQRREGRAIFPYGIPGLDTDLETNEPRLLPGAYPGQITVVTGVSGSGKSTLTARIALGLARQRRKVLYGAWEMTGGLTLELLACMSLNWSRTDLIAGRISEEALSVLEERMQSISKYVKFLANPFKRNKGERTSNDRNLDILHGYISENSPDVFIADLWKKCLANTDPDQEEDALGRQLVMAQDTKCHCILVQQQRSKDIEARPDKRPTREGVKGSSAWIDTADTVLAVHNPALWKRVENNRLEVIILKQRLGKWPMAIEFDYNPEKGSIEGGTNIPYDTTPTDEMMPGAPKLSKFAPPKGKVYHGKKTS